jgi:pyruvate/2-oxoglutarate dehydrogenase complex dihydrolipoamide acyltransferase (E2) component
LHLANARTLCYICDKKMRPSYTFQRIPRSRIATFDVYSVALHKHHVSAMLEFDVTDSRRKLQELRRSGLAVSFNAWLIKSISQVLEQHKEAAAYLYSKRKLMVFDDINISILVEKKVEGKKVPIALLLDKTNEKSALEINEEIEKAKTRELSGKEVLLRKKLSRVENIYFSLPGFLRRSLWRLMLKNPRLAFGRMGNVVITSVGMMGTIKGWFLHKSVHPLSFGIGSVLKKPVVIGDQVRVREILNMTVLCDHDVLDGAPMVKFLNGLTKHIENGEGIRH